MMRILRALTGPNKPTQGVSAIRFRYILWVMDLQQIAYFVQVADLCSFSRAAHVLGVTQPALSRQVSLLEAELGCRLLHRHGRGVVPTEAGQRMLAHGQALLAHAEQVKRDVRAVIDTGAGRVSIGLPPRVAHCLTPVLLRAFRDSDPQVAINVVEALSAQLREALLAGRLDLALLYDPPATSQLDCVPLFREEMVLVGHPPDGDRLPAAIPVADLGRYPMILPSRPNAIRTVVEAACRTQDVALDIVAEVDAVHTQLRMAAEGQGYTVLPRSTLSATARAADLAWAPIGSPALRNRLVLATSRSKPPGAAAGAVGALIQRIDWTALFEGRPALP